MEREPGASTSRSTRTWVAGAAAGILALVAASCGVSSTSNASATTEVVAHVGNLEIIHPFLPDPPSPSVASIYLTVRNTGSSADQLVAISSPVAPTSKLMTDDSDGSMVPLVDLAIPPHGEASLAPGHNHLMLENTTTAFKVGQVVAVTLRFAQAGAVSVDVPVVPLSSITDNGGMANMKGM